VKLSALEYAFPEEATAQRPAPDRESARLLLVPRGGGFSELTVADLPRLFVPGDVLVVNDTRVRPARLLGRKPTGAKVELLVLQHRPDGTWTAMVRASRSPAPSSVVELPGDAAVRVVAREGELFVLAEERGDLAACLEAHGRPPLPPYIRRESDESDVQRYQSAFARADAGDWGSAGSSVAAPTAGLHLGSRVLAALEEAGVTVARVGLGVGVGTFRPIEAPRVEDHRMHEEAFAIPEAAAAAVSSAVAQRRRVTAVGTTSLRALEAAASPRGALRAVVARTGLFAVPGSRFRVVSRLLTNFHRPGSTLIALVAAFAGAERALAAHREAVTRGFRLFSYGDAMLVERAAP
jgi:S-adenosylmethionine:tRNA ribosyltransferase-isomerase